MDALLLNPREATMATDEARVRLDDLSRAAVFAHRAEQLLLAALREAAQGSPRIRLPPCGPWRITGACEHRRNRG